MLDLTLTSSLDFQSRESYGHGPYTMSTVSRFDRVETDGRTDRRWEAIALGYLPR